MKLKFKKKTAKREVARKKNRMRVRRKVTGTTERPRLCVFRSSKYIYAQIIDDSTGKTLASADSKADKTNSREAAKKVGETIAKKAQAANVASVVFDRSGYIYHGKIKSLADGAREAGLKF
ncbi:MAG: 50S ribosomal protein L18 [Bdellovibrionaceae bacterium]|nr:50S ribosomal protein L18 [Pseudobdellovibrionaceae bacterium]